MNIGNQLRQAREARKISVSDAAAATRMKSQHVEALETEDFDRFASPVYARGFLKLYAEYLGLDPAPLLREYAAARSPAPRPPLLPPTVALPSRRFRSESPESGVVETSAAPLPVPSAPELRDTVVAAAPDVTPHAEAAPESDAATLGPPRRPRRALLVAAGIVILAAAAAGILSRPRTPRRSPTPTDRAPVRFEAVSPILELPPEPLADPFAPERASNAP